MNGIAYHVCLNRAYDDWKPICFEMLRGRFLQVRRLTREGASLGRAPIPGRGFDSPNISGALEFNGHFEKITDGPGALNPSDAGSNVAKFRTVPQSEGDPCVSR